ncbi:unnamed protein product [Rhizophagus irregularis]|nr:unnamed protein product [Rhizophagus irregularis]
MASSLSVDSNPQARKDEATDLLEESVNIVLTTLDIVFDEDVKYVDSPEDEINTSHPKERKIYIETPQDCALLDPRCKELRFASDHLKVQTQKELELIFNFNHLR